MRSNYLLGNARDLIYDDALGPQLGLCACSRNAFVKSSLRKFLYKFLNELLKKSSPKVPYERKSFETSGHHKCFDYMWSQNGLRMSQISMFQLTLRKTDSERQLQTSSCVVAFEFFHSTSLNISILRSNYLQGNARDLGYDDALGPQLGLCVCSRNAFVECSLRKFLYKFLNELLKKSSPKVPYERILSSTWSSQMF